VTEPAQTEVGTAYVTVIPSARGFARQLQKDIAKEFRGANLDKLIGEALSGRAVSLPVKPTFDPKDLPDELPTRPGREPKLPVTVDPLLREFQSQIRRELTGLSREAAAQIPVSADTDQLRAEIAASITAIEQQLKAKVPTEPADRREYELQLRTLVDQARTTVKAAIPTEADTAGFVAEVEHVADQAERTVDVNVPVDVDQRGVDATGRQAGGQLASGILSTLPNALSGAPLVTFGGLIAGAAVAGPAIGASIAAGILGGIGLGVIGLGAIGQRNNPAVKQAVDGTVGIINDTLAEASAPLEGPFIEGLTIIAETVQDLGPELREMFDAIAPYIPTLAQGVADFLKAFTPGLVDAVKESGPLLEAIAFNLGPLGETAADFLRAIAENGPAAVQLLNVVFELINFLLPLIGFMVTNLSNAFSLLYMSVTGLVALVTGAWDLITGAVEGGVDGVRDLVERLVGWLLRRFHEGWDGARKSAGDALGSVLRLLQGLPGRAQSALGNLGGVLWRAGLDLINGLINGILGAIPGLESTLGWVTSIIPDWKGPLDHDRRLLMPAGEAIMSGLIRGIISQTPGLRAELMSITDLIAGSPFADPPAATLAAGLSLATPSPGGLVAEWVGDAGEPIVAGMREHIRITYGGNVDDALGAEG
jgi:hypothetical protein